jgi:hypothetical protein
MLRHSADASLEGLASVDRWSSVTLDFFGTRVRYRASDPETIARIAYIFQRFADDRAGEPDLEFALCADGASPFVRAILEPGCDAYAFHRVPGGDRWTPWTHQDTPFPPLQLAPLKGRFLVVHGCAVADGDRGVAFVAPSMAGKTTLLIELCRRGLAAVSDDLLFIDPGSGKMALYRKPVGFRQGTLALFPELARQDILDRALCFEALGASPKTWLVHLDELLPGCYHDRPWVPIRALVLLDRNDNDTGSALSPTQALLRILPQAISSGMTPTETMSAVAALAQGRPIHVIDSSDLERASDRVLALLRELADAPERSRARGA